LYINVVLFRNVNAGPVKHSLIASSVNARKRNPFACKESIKPWNDL
jgi:hypothetical protein